MAELENALAGILSDPDAMMKIKALGEQLGLGESSLPQSTNSQHNQNSQNFAQSHTNSAPNPLGDLSSLGGISSLANLGNMKELTRLLPIISSMNKEDETTALLSALRPFLGAERQKKLDDAEKILRIMKLLPFIRKSGIF